MARFDRRLQLLATNPSFRWYVISCLLATFGSGLSYVAITWLILQAKNNLSSVAFLMFTFWVPIVIFGPLFGVIADRHSRKWLLVGANGARALVLVLFGWYLYYHLTASMLYVLMAMIGTCFSIYLPAAIALIRQIVEPDDLLYANSMVDIAYELGNVLGMGSAGFFISVFSGPTTIVINGIIFIFCTMTMIVVRVKKSDPGVSNVSAHIVKDFKLGLNYLAQHRSLMIIYSAQLLILVGFMTTPVLLAPFAKDILHATVSQFGRIDAALSVGVVTGGLFIPQIANRWGLIRSLIYMCLGLALSFSLFAVNRHIFMAEVLYFFVGFGLSVWSMIVTQAQRMTHIDFQARVQSVFHSLSGVMILIIYLLVALASSYISLPILYGVEVAMTLVAVFLLWINRQQLCGGDAPHPGM